MASDAGQSLRIDRKLRQAREQLLICADPSCPEIVRVACSAWVTGIDAQMPSIVTHVRETDGRDALDTTLTLDDARTPLKQGVSIELDPGPHTLKFVSPAGRRVQKSIIVSEGEKLRRVDVTFPPAVVHSQTSSVPWAAWAMTGVATVAWVTFAGFAVSGHSDYENATDASEYPTTKFVVADVALGAAVISTGVALTLFLLHHDAAKSSAASPRFDLVRF